MSHEIAELGVANVLLDTGRMACVYLMVTVDYYLLLSMFMQCAAALLLPCLRGLDEICTHCFPVTPLQPTFLTKVI